MNPVIEEAVHHLLETERPVLLHELMGRFGNRLRLSHVQERQLFRQLRQQGYLSRAASITQELDARDSGRDSDRTASMHGELRVLEGEVIGTPGALSERYTSNPGAILHVVGATLPKVKSSYTIRTHSLALKGTELGLDTTIVGQIGTYDVKGYVAEEHDRVRYYRMPGPARGSLPLDQWFELFVTRLSAVVRKVRPSVLIPASDFINASAAQTIANEYGIPVVYDLRGFWEDSWLARKSRQHSWNAQTLERMGMPDVWTLRRERESELIAQVDAIIAQSAKVATQAVELGANPQHLTTLGNPSDSGLSYIQLLERVNAVAPGSTTVSSSQYEDVSVMQFRDCVASAHRRPLERIAATGVRGSTEEIRKQGWKLASLAPVRLDLPFDWKNACLDNRSQAFHLHAWDFIVPFLSSWDSNRDKESLQWALDRALSWCTTFNEDQSRETMAWYDMALGLRLPRLAYLVQEAVAMDADDDALATLWIAVTRHQREVFADRAFNPRTNHGFYTAVGQLAFARRLDTLPAMKTLTEQANSRLHTIVHTQFAEDGGHLEHSPDYHRMLLESFLDAADDGLIGDEAIVHRLRRAARVMGWLIQPDQTILQIGDSPATPVDPKVRVMQEERTQFIASRGASGIPERRELLTLPHTGYAIIRSPQPRTQEDHHTAGYLSLMGSFHSRAHKHCDDLSITWFDSGMEILVDAGRFGYLDQLPPDAAERELGFFYGRPERQYVETTRAHNTVEADGRDHERRLRTPYGSAVTESRELDGHFQLRGRVDHGHWVHDRAVTYLPGEWLLIDDRVASGDSDPHDYRVWWNLPGAFETLASESGILSFQADKASVPLHLVSLDASQIDGPVRGESEPVLRGWRSRLDYEFEPSWSVAFVREGVMHHRFRSLFSFGDRPRLREPSHPF